MQHIRRWMFTYVRNTPREYFNFVCALSLGLGSMATLMAVQFQPIENAFLTPKPNTIITGTPMCPFLWRIAIGSAVLPIAWILERLIPYRHRNSDAQYKPCPTCGYDLRATPDRCPECGEVSKKVKSIL